jgi:hypothetical protein
MARRALAALVALFGAVQPSVIDMTCDGIASADGPAINAVTDRSSPGDLIWIHGDCVVTETIAIRGERSHRGDSRTGTVVTQANGSNLAAVVASDGFIQNNRWTDTPVSIAHLSINGNVAGNPGALTAGLALRVWFSTVNEVKVSGCAGDGLLISSATPRAGNCPNSRWA